MTSREKASMLRPAIEQLYSNEGRSISYISRLLEIDRSMLSKIIREWGLQVAKPQRHANPSTQKFINNNRQKIKDMLDRDVSITKIASEFKMDRASIVKTIICQDEMLKNAYDASKKRQKEKHTELVERQKQQSSRNYDFEDIDGEEWREILGYPRYMVSSKGRVKARAKRYNSWYLMTPCPNKNNGRLYVALVNENGKTKNLMLARIVANTFLKKDDETKTTVNHIDGDVTNNAVENLEWTTQSENNTHAYRELGRVKNRTYGHSKYDYIFSGVSYPSITALAEGMGKSWTQVSRYLQNPELHGITVKIKDRYL